MATVVVTENTSCDHADESADSKGHCGAKLELTFHPPDGVATFLWREKVSIKKDNLPADQDGKRPKLVGGEKRIDTAKCDDYQTIQVGNGGRMLSFLNDHSIKKRKDITDANKTEQWERMVEQRFEYSTDGGKDWMGAGTCITISQKIAATIVTESEKEQGVEDYVTLNITRDGTPIYSHKWASE